METLDDALYDQITALCKQGDDLFETGRLDEALERYNQAWALLPDPKHQWEAATWILTAIGDANYTKGDYQMARNALTGAMHCPDAIGNPFIHLRLGECQFELGDLDRAADELMRAYMGAGPEIFEGDDPKYLRFLSTRAKDIEVPPGD